MIQLDWPPPQAPPPETPIAPRILSPEVQQQFEGLRGLLQRALWLVEKCADVEAVQILRTRLTNLQSAAMLVIVGEVKAGKSSFINALVGEDICRVAPEPATIRIQELAYGLDRSVATLGSAWERVYLPKEVLRELTIVDTPGTNSIVRDHQAITENYIPQSDLVVFVFSAQNPHTNSAWEFLSAIRKEWHRKMVFVLQQSDRASDWELKTNREHVKQYALERGLQNPTIFTLSAKREMEGTADSGFSEFRNFLRYGVECGEVWRTKVEGAYQTTRSVMGKLLTHLRAEKAALADERVFYQQLLRKVETRQDRTDVLKLSIIGQLASSYDRLARDSEDQFAESLRFGEIFRGAIPFASEKAGGGSFDELRARFHQSTRGEIARIAPQVAQTLLGEMQALTEELSQNVARRQERIREGVDLPQTAGRVEMLDRLKAKLAGLRVGEINQIVSDTVGEAADIRKLTIAGCGLVPLGLILALVGHNFWLGVIGGIFALIGALLLVTGMFWRRSGLMRDFRSQLGVSRKEFRDHLESHVAQIFDGLFHEVKQALSESVFRLDVQESFLVPLLEETFQVGEAASDAILRTQRGGGR